MKQRPILFSTAMVQAILAGSKTQTRRVVKEPFQGWMKTANNPEWWESILSQCSFGKQGDVLWVRETWMPMEQRPQGVDQPVWYKADQENGMTEGLPWKPSIHMPKEAARIWLEITNVRVERLQDISEDDCKSEGVIKTQNGYKNYNSKYPCKEFIGGNTEAFRSFFSLWQSIHGHESWELNPWVWVVEFKRIKKP